MSGPALTVIVPLGGLGQRFQNEGHFSRPKPFVRVFGKEMILWVLDNLSLREGDELVLAFNPTFMCLGEWMRSVVRGKYPKSHLVELPGPTRGAAETVLLALKGIPESARRRPVMLCDGDCYYTYDIVETYRKVASTHGGSFVFHDTQPKPMYSYCTLNDSDEIIETKEKIKISDWANTGCYCFRNGMQLASECEALISQGEMQLSQDKIPEYYTSGVIARMLAAGEKFKALKLPPGDINVLGTPAQVETWVRDRHPMKAITFAVCLSALCPLPRPTIDSLPEVAEAGVVNFLKDAFAQGHKIVILTKKLSAGQASKVKAWLVQHSVAYSSLDIGAEPDYDFFIGRDTLDPLLGSLQRQSGFYGSNPAKEGPSASTPSSFEGLPSFVTPFLLGLLVGAVVAAKAVRR